MTRGPSTNGSIGRDARGRFSTGNPGGPGNPHAKKVAQLRSTLVRSVSQKDLREITKALIQKAKSGDVVAIREVFDRLFGKGQPVLETPASESDEYLERLERMTDEEIVAEFERLGLEPPFLCQIRAGRVDLAQ